MSLSEVKTKACLDTLETLVGLSEFDIDDLFKDVDINGDGLVVKTEVAGAMKNLALDRKGTEAPPPIPGGLSSPYSLGIGTSIGK